jgi:hypothetical protein
MIFPSIYVFILFSIPTLYAEEDYDDYDSDYEICDFEYIRNCSSYTTGLTNLTEQSGEIEIIFFMHGLSCCI